MTRTFAAFLLGIATCCAWADEPPPGIVGKDGWLFYRYEAMNAAAAADTKTSLKLIARLGRVLEHNGVTLVVALVPVKMRLYAQHLPDDFKLTPYMATHYRELAKSFAAEKVRLVDLDAAFLASPKRDSDTPLYFRLDTHWSPVGAMLAAETIKAALEADPALSKAIHELPEVKYSIAWDEQKKPNPANDLVPQLPKGSPALALEPATTFSVKREKAPEGGLLDAGFAPGVVLVGSSYSADWTLFADAFRYVLQRELLDVSVPASKGPWVGMESYLRDDAFQTQRPKVIVWELPERDMQAPPMHKYREARYNIDNTEWLLRVAAWVESKCEPASIAVKAKGGKLAEGGAAEEGDYMELVFTRPIDKLEYLSARLLNEHSNRVTLEASAGSVKRRFTLTVAGDDTPHAFRTPLVPETGKGFDKVRIYPGKTRRFSLEDVQVCRQQENLLK